MAMMVIGLSVCVYFMSVMCGVSMFVCMCPYMGVKCVCEILCVVHACVYIFRYAYRGQRTSGTTLYHPTLSYSLDLVTGSLTEPRLFLVFA